MRSIRAVRTISQIKPKFCLAIMRIGAMACKAPVGKNGKNVSAEGYFLCIGGEDCGAYDTTADKGDAKDHPDQFSYDTHSKLL